MVINFILNDQSFAGLPVEPLFKSRELMFYKTFNYKVFQSLEHRFLTHKWDHSNEEKRIKEIYHNIRNKYNNNKHKFNPDQLELFEEGEFLLGSVR